MRLSLSHVTALLALAIAFATAPGVPVSRVGGREGSARAATRGGSPRFETSEAVLHPPDHQPADATLSGEFADGVTKRSDNGGWHALPQSRPGFRPPQAHPRSPGLSAGDALTRTGKFLRPPGRASPHR